MNEAASRTIVIGGGIVGLSTAIWLLRAGRAVTLIDPADAKRRASFGNAGVLAACSVAPVTMPGLTGNVLRHAFDPDFPLYIRPTYLPRLVPWLVRYLKHCNAMDAARISRALAPLLRDTLAQHKALADGTPAMRWIKSSDYLFAYPSRAAFEQEAAVWQLRRDAGFAWTELTGGDLRELDPALGPAIQFGLLLGDHGMILNPGAYLDDLHDHAIALGAEVKRGRVLAFGQSADGVTTRVICEDGEHAAETIVIATGAWSKPLVAQLGLNVPLETERGYHVMLRGASLAPRQPTMVASGKFVVTPMADGVRCAGVIEFGGLQAQPSPAPPALIMRKLHEAFPTLEFNDHEEWLGHRPAPADSLPLIGAVPGHPGTYLAFGHHHIGMTSGPKTGRLLAAMITRGQTDLDMTPYSPSRFAPRAAG